MLPLNLRFLKIRMSTIRNLAPIFLLGLMLPSLVACGSSSTASSAEAATMDSEDGTSAEEAKKPGILVRVGEVSQEPMVAYYSTSATLRSEKVATVTSRTDGVVQKLMVEEGDRVRTGDPLAYLENDEQSIAHERSRAVLETERSEFARTERLFRQELVSEEVFETARRELQDLEHAARLAELELSRTVIRAPFGGVVLSRELDVGNTVTSGTAFYRLADVNPLFADVNVPERQVARLSKGQEVRLTLDAGGQEVLARIERIAPAVEVETGTVKVTLSVPGGGKLRPGSFVKVDVVTDTRQDALVVPRSALVAEGRRWFVYRVAADGATVAQTEVELGYESSEAVEIVPAAGAGELDPGSILGAGDAVVVTGAGALSDGAAIEIAPEEASTAASSASPAAGDVRS